MQASICESARRYRAADPLLCWLPQLLLEASLDPTAGILVAFNTVPEQGGELAYATWLTYTGQFYAIEALLEYGSHRLLLLERLADLSSAVEISSHRPGIGKTFGAIALEVLAALQGTNTAQCGLKER